MNNSTLYQIKKECTKVQQTSLPTKQQIIQTGQPHQNVSQKTPRGWPLSNIKHATIHVAGGDPLLVIDIGVAFSDPRR